MGNLFCCCLGVGGRRRTKSNVHPAATETTPLQPHPKEIPVNQSVPETSSPDPYPHHQYPSPPPYFLDAVTVRNDANLRKETLTLEPDPVNPGRLLVAFTFDAVVSGRITVVFFAKEDVEFQLIATKENTLPPTTFDFELGLGQKFIQPSGTGVELSVFEDSELFNEMDTDGDVIPLAIKLEAATEGGNSGSMQITQVSYVKEEGEIKPRAMKQLLFVDGTRYELQEVYGIGDTLDGCNANEDASESGKECVVCLSEPRDMTVLPCRHMCMCGGCAEEVRFQTNLCPVCRQPVERFLKIQLSD